MRTTLMLACSMAQVEGHVALSDAAKDTVAGKTGSTPTAHRAAED